MKKTSEPIVFFGSGPVAAKSLVLLVNDFAIEAVVTKPKPPHHHGDFPVIDVATKLNLPMRTVSSKLELSGLVATKPFKSRLAVLIDFGIIVGQDAIDYFPLGIVNSHFSLLPDLRGADPITFAILSGQKTTGVSLMLLVKAMDAGPLLATSPYDLSPSITTPELTENLIDASYHSLVNILPLYLDGAIKPMPQDASINPTYSRKLTKADGVVDWTKSAEQIEREIRAYTGWPKSSTQLGGKEVILIKSRVAKLTGKPGAILEKKPRLVIACGKNALEIIKLKPTGKNEMTAEAFLAGHSHLL